MASHHLRHKDLNKPVTLPMGIFPVHITYPLHNMHPVATVVVLLVESNIVCKGDAASTYYKKIKVNNLEQKRNLYKGMP